MTGFWVCPAVLFAADHVRPVLIIHFVEEGRPCPVGNQLVQDVCVMIKKMHTH